MDTGFPILYHFQSVLCFFPWGKSPPWRFLWFGLSIKLCRFPHLTNHSNDCGRTNLVMRARIIWHARQNRAECQLECSYTCLAHVRGGQSLMESGTVHCILWPRQWLWPAIAVFTNLGQIYLTWNFTENLSGNLSWKFSWNNTGNSRRNISGNSL